MNREILREFDAAGISFATSTLEIVGMPELRMRRAGNEVPR